MKLRQIVREWRIGWNQAALKRCAEVLDQIDPGWQERTRTKHEVGLRSVEAACGLGPHHPGQMCVKPRLTFTEPTL